MPTTARRFVRSPWQRLGISKATYYRWLEKKDSKLPRLVKIFANGRAVACDEAALEAYMAERTA